MNVTCKFMAAVAAILAMMATEAGGAYPDGFEDYADGSGIIGQGTWIGWEGNNDDAIVTTDEAHTGTKSLRLGGEDMVDIVPEFTGVTSGVWQYTVWTYIPETTIAGGFDMGGMSAHFGSQGAPATQWFKHIQFDLGPGNIGDPPIEQPIKYNEWAEVKSILDVDAKEFTLYYDCVEAYSGTWGGDNAIVGFDVWTPAGTDDIYIDDVDMIFLPGMVWQGNDGLWSDENWDDGEADQSPKTNGRMFIDATTDTGGTITAASLVTVDADFIHDDGNGDGPVASISVGAEGDEDNGAKLVVAAGVTLEVSGQTEAFEFGTIAMENGATLDTCGAFIEVDGALVSGVQGNDTDGTAECGLLKAHSQLTLDEYDDGTTMYGGPNAIAVDWIPLPADPGDPASAAASMFGGVYRIAKYVGEAQGQNFDPDAKTDNEDGNIGAAYIKSVDYAVDINGDQSLYAIDVELHPQGIGDTDLDGAVGPADLANFGLGWSPTATDKTWYEGDFDFDGAVGPADLAAFGLAWAPNGIQFPTGFDVGVIPEPGTIVMLYAGLLGLLLHGGRGRRCRRL